METSAYQAVKLSFVSVLALSKDALHIYFGLGVFLLTALLARRPITSFVPLIAVLVFALIAELLDARDDIATYGIWRVAASVHDIVNTVVMPITLFLLGRFSRLLR